MKIIEDIWELAKLHKINILDDYDTKGLELFTYVVIDIFHMNISKEIWKAN